MRSNTQPASFKKNNRYQLLRWLGSENRGVNNTALTTKQTKTGESQWYMKKITYKTGCLYEVVGQEFVRLLIPGQPKTRHATDGIDNEFVVSKAVEGFTEFLDIDYLELAKNLCDHTYYGLGWVLVASLIVCDSDLNLGNIGINMSANVGRRQVIKIDGDFAFSLNRDADDVINPSGMNITKQVIADLPLVSSYGAPRWLHQRVGKVHQCSYSEKLQKDPIFKEEVHQAILRALILPSRLIEIFVNIYCGVGSGESAILIRELNERIEQLKLAIQDDDGFISYLSSAAAVVELEKYWHYLEVFTTTGKQNLIKSAGISKEDVYKQFNGLRDTLNTEQSSARVKLTQIGLPSSVNYSFTSKDDVIRAFPALRKKYWQETSGCPDEARPEMVVKFLAAYREFIEKTVISWAEADEIVNAAYENNVCCFCSIYEALSFKLENNKDQITPLGFYTKFSELLLKFSNVKTEENLIKICEKFESLYVRWEHMFAPDTGGYNAIDINSTITSTIGIRIKWVVYVKVTDENYYNYCNNVRHPVVAKMLFRLGVAHRRDILDLLSLDVIRDRVNHQSIFGVEYVNPASGKKERGEYLPESVYYKQIRRRVVVRMPEADTPRCLAEVISLIKQNEMALSCVEVFQAQLSDLESRIQSFFNAHSNYRRQFVRDFFLNPDCDYGIHHLRRIRLALMLRAERKFGAVTKNEHETKPFSEEVHFYSHPVFMSMLIKSVPDDISFPEFLQIIDAHFFVERLPLSIYLAISPDKHKFTEDDLSSVLLSVIHSTILSKWIKNQLVLEIVFSQRVKSCPLTFEMIDDIYSFFLDSSDPENSDNYLTCLSLLTAAVNQLDVIEREKAGSMIRMLKDQLKPEEEIPNPGIEDLIKMLYCPAKPDLQNPQLVQAIQGLIDAISERVSLTDTPPKWLPRPM